MIHVFKPISEEEDYLASVFDDIIAGKRDKINASHSEDIFGNMFDRLKNKYDIFRKEHGNGLPIRVLDNTDGNNSVLVGTVSHIVLTLPWFLFDKVFDTESNIYYQIIEQDEEKYSFIAKVSSSSKCWDFSISVLPVFTDTHQDNLTVEKLYIEVFCQEDVDTVKMIEVQETLSRWFIPNQYSHIPATQSEGELAKFIKGSFYIKPVTISQMERSFSYTKDFIASLHDDESPCNIIHFLTGFLHEFVSFKFIMYDYGYIRVAINSPFSTEKHDETIVWKSKEYDNMYIVCTYSPTIIPTPEIEIDNYSVNSIDEFMLFMDLIPDDTPLM